MLSSKIRTIAIALVATSSFAATSLVPTASQAAKINPARNAAAKGKLGFAYRPRHQVACIIKTRVLPGDPAMGNAMHVQRKDERCVSHL